MENRKNEEGEREHRELFCKDGTITRKDFYSILNKQPNKGVIAHKMVFSMERSNFENKNIDYKELTKDIMSAYEMKTGRQYNWVACIHDKQSNPHVHIVIAGRDEQGKEVVFMPAQLNQLKKISEKECERHAERNLLRNQEPEFDFEKQLQDEKTIVPSKTREQLTMGNEKEMDYGYER